MNLIIAALLLSASFLAGQSPNLSLPQWLIPYPGASSASTASSALIESSYTTAATPAEVAEHYGKLFKANGFTFLSNFDGLGNAIRASAPECDLLIKIRESSSGTAVKVTCASKQVSAQAGSGDPVIVTSGSASPSGPSTRTTPSGYHLKSAEEIRQYNADRAREIQARREALEREGNARMQQYDKPVYPQSVPQTRAAPAAPAAPVPSTPLAHYHDDAPPLVWPSWLESVNGEKLSAPNRTTRGPDSSLSREYKTTLAMTEVQQFYKQRLISNGFTIRKSWIGAGSTSAGVKQNSNGEVEGDRLEGSGPNPPRTTIKVSFRRSYLNEPITVWLSITVTGSFGR
jgi:hypothetical protein